MSNSAQDLSPDTTMEDTNLPTIQQAFHLIINVIIKAGITKHVLHANMGRFSDLCHGITHGCGVWERKYLRQYLGFPIMKPGAQVEIDYHDSDARNLRRGEPNGVCITHVSQCFEFYFKEEIEGSCNKPEGVRKQAILQICDLTEWATRSRAFICLLDSCKRPDIGLAEISKLLEKQPRGESGPLLTNGRANIFFVDRPPLFEPVVIVVRWDAGWDICTWPGIRTDCYDCMGPGTRIFGSLNL